MKKAVFHIFAFIFLYSSICINGQKTEVLTLGTFHFNFPNLDLKKIDKADQIDVLEPVYQEEIEKIVSMLAKFRPTIICIERDPEKQAKYDSLYSAYLSGKYALSRSEDEQLGFRLARLMSLKKLSCVNAWGRDYEIVERTLDNPDSVEFRKFMKYFYKNQDSLLSFYRTPVFKTEGILAELRMANTESAIRMDLGNYLIGIFRYETKDDEYFGPDFVTGWWFNRNLRIFRNIQKLNASPSDRILVIFGAGHMNLMNFFFNSSPQYKLVNANDYLKMPEHEE